MKNLKTKRIVLIALSLMLLIGSVIGITVSAANDDTYEIKSINIAYGDKAYVLMAVDASVEDAAAGNVEVTYSIGENNYTATYWPELTANAEKNPSGLPVFYTVGIAPKDIGEDIIAEAHVKGATDYTPNYENVSLAEYLYHMLYAKGRINATAENEIHAKTVYETLLAYGAAAQQYFWNDDPDNATDRVLVTNRSYVYVDGATINPTGENELLLPGKTGTVTLLPTATVASWNVTTYDEDGNAATTSVTGNEIDIAGHTVITAVPTTLRGHGEYAGDSRTESYESFNGSSSSITTSSWNGTGSWNKLATDTEGKYLYIGKNGSDLDSTTFVIDKTEEITDKISRNVFETDFMWAGGSAALNGRYIAFLRFYDDTSTTHAVNIQLYVNAEGKLYFDIAKDVLLDVGTWYNLKFVVDEYGSVNMYVNGTKVGSAGAFSTGRAKNATKVTIEPRNGSSIGVSGSDNAYGFYLDNTFTARVNVLPQRGYGKYANDETYASKVETYQNFKAKTTADSTETSNPNITAVHWTWTDKWTKLLSDIEGKYFNIGRNGNSAFGARPIFTVDTTEDLTGKTCKTVFESDILWGAHNEALNGRNLGFIRLATASNTNAGTIYLYVSADGKLYFGTGSNKAIDYSIDVGEWANLRIEIVGTSTIKVYVNDELAYTDFGATAVTAENITSVQFEMRNPSSINSAAPAEAGVFSLSLDNTFCARVEDK